MSRRVSSARVLFVSAVLAAACVAGAQANIVIDTVPVGNAGNPGDVRYGGYGFVDYTYDIGKYEVTAGQYTAFLNAVAGVDTYGLYNMSMWSSSESCKIERYAGNGTPGNPYKYRVANDTVGGYRANRPVTCVSYWNCCRFANWLHNGQPTGAQGPGTTETGAYTLNGYNGTDGRTIQRNAGCKWAVTSENEWYKAAYHKNDGVTGDYYNYPMSSDSEPGRDLNDPSGNNANFYGDPYPIQSPYYTTVGGQFANSASPYGTFDQGGNVYEWNESIGIQDATNSFRCVRGGSFKVNGPYRLHASYHYYSYFPSFVLTDIGFRVCEIPEPATIWGLALGCMGLLRRRRAVRG